MYVDIFYPLHDCQAKCIKRDYSQVIVLLLYSNINVAFEVYFVIMGSKHHTLVLGHARNTGKNHQVNVTLLFYRDEENTFFPFTASFLWLVRPDANAR